MATIINPYRYAGWDGFGDASRLFNGTNDYISMGDVLDFEYNEEISISFWLKHPSAAQEVAIAKQDSPEYRGYGVYINSPTADNINFGWQNKGTTPQIYHYVATTDDGCDLSDNAWHHVVLTKGTDLDLSSFKTYFDSVSRTVGTSLGASHTSTTLTTAPLAIGARNAGGTPNLYFDGRISDMRIYDAVKTQEEVDSLFAGKDVQTDLVGWWKMNETGGSGTTIEDFAGSNFDSTTNLTDASTDGPAD